MVRAYSLITLKAIDEEQRVIDGVATTPKTDRMQDIVEPMGGVFALPLPFLWQHNTREPIGHVIAAAPSPEGIPVRIQLARTDEPGELKNFLDRAWQSIKLGLVRGLSLGLNPLEMAEIAGTWGLHITKWEWLELSAVTIPANEEATIQRVKSYDAPPPAALGVVARTSPPGATGSVKRQPLTAGVGPVKISEQITAFEATRAAKTERLNTIQQKAADEGRTKDQAEQEEFDTLRDELKSIDKELVDLADLERHNVAVAKHATGRTVAEASTSRGVATMPVRQLATALPGIRFARTVKCIGLSYRTRRDVAAVAAELYPEDPAIAKAAVAAGTTSDATWAGPLVGDESAIFADFVEFLRPQTILGKFGAGNVPGLRRVPFRVPLIGQTSGGAGYWVGEGKAKPLTKFDFERKTLEQLKVANIAVLTEEVLRSSAPSAEMLVRDQLAAALRERLDIDFIDPAKAVSAGISPASITNGVAAITSSGNTADAVRADLKALFDAFIADNNAPTSGVIIMTASTALALSLMMNPLGQPEFPNLGMNGGTLAGLPVIVSEYVPTESDGSIVVMANAQDIYLADEGGISLDVSREASLEMDSAPSHDSSTPTPSQLVSLWQTNSVGFRAERTINWLKRRAQAVQYLEAVNWGETV